MKNKQQKTLLLGILIIILIIAGYFIAQSKSGKDPFSTSISEGKVKESSEGKEFLLDYVSVIIDLKSTEVVDTESAEDYLRKLTEKAELNKLKISKWENNSNPTIKETTRLLLASLTYLEETKDLKYVDDFKSKMNLFHKSLRLSGEEISKNNNNLQLSQEEKDEVANYIYKNSTFRATDFIDKLNDPNNTFSGEDVALFNVIHYTVGL